MKRDGHERHDVPITISSTMIRMSTRMHTYIQNVPLASFTSSACFVSCRISSAVFSTASSMRPSRRCVRAHETARVKAISRTKTSRVETYVMLAGLFVHRLCENVEAVDAVADLRELFILCCTMQAKG